MPLQRNKPRHRAQLDLEPEVDAGAHGRRLDPQPYGGQVRFESVPISSTHNPAAQAFGADHRVSRTSQLLRAPPPAETQITCCCTSPYSDSRTRRSLDCRRRAGDQRVLLREPIQSGVQSGRSALIRGSTTMPARAGELLTSPARPALSRRRSRAASDPRRTTTWPATASVTFEATVAGRRAAVTRCGSPWQRSSRSRLADVPDRSSATTSLQQASSRSILNTTPAGARPLSLAREQVGRSSSSSQTPSPLSADRTAPCIPSSRSRTSSSTNSGRRPPVDLVH